MKIYIVTNNIDQDPRVYTDEKKARKDTGAVYHRDVPVDVEFLEASLLAIKLAEKINEQANEEKIKGLVDLLGCDRDRAKQIIKESGA